MFITPTFILSLRFVNSGVSDYNLTLHCRNIGNKTYVPTTWKILFDLKEVDKTGNYTLWLALASANLAELQVRNIFQC